MTTFNDNFLRACRGQPVDHTPVWFMRQAGRYQAEYRALKQDRTIYDIIKNPELCAYVTKLPLDQLGVDAAILFSDIMTPIAPMGLENEIKPNYGPYVPDPVRNHADVQQLSVPHYEQATPYVAETIQQVMDEINIPLIGFCGAPFTLASYMVEGGKSKNYEHTKSLMYNQPAVWHELMEKLTDAMLNYLDMQVQAGAQAVQIFDSWVGNLSQPDYATYIFPHMERLFRSLKYLEVPTVLFGVNTLHLLSQFKATGCDVVGVDWRVDIGVAWQVMEQEVAVMGNLDPTAVLGPDQLIYEKVQGILDSVGAEDRQRGFIFNLGHGVIPSLSPDKLRKVVEYVHTQTRQ